MPIFSGQPSTTGRRSAAVEQRLRLRLISYTNPFHQDEFYARATSGLEILRAEANEDREDEPIAAMAPLDSFDKWFWFAIAAVRHCHAKPQGTVALCHRRPTHRFSFATPSLIDNRRPRGGQVRLSP